MPDVQTVADVVGERKCLHYLNSRYSLGAAKARLAVVPASFHLHKTNNENK